VILLKIYLFVNQSFPFPLGVEKNRDEANPQ